MQCIVYRIELCDGIGFLDFTPGDRSTIDVIEIFVEKKYRRQGFGSHLLFLLAQWCLSKRYHSIALESILSEENDFYSRLGFLPMHSPPDGELLIKTRDFIKKFIPKHEIVLSDASVH